MQGFAPAARAAGFGIAAGGDIQSERPSTLARDLDAIRDAGAKWLRIDINWAQIQRRGPWSYEWEPSDRVVYEAGKRGLKILGVIVYTPVWARPQGSSATHRPRAAAYAKFAAEAVQHYLRLGVHAYEIWNEPNISSAWSPHPQPGRYAQLLEAAYPAIKRADPEATVISGGTAPAPSDGININPAAFLKRIYAHGAGDSFDAVGHHPYSWPALAGERRSWSAWYQMYGTRPSLRSVMSDHGDRGKRIWATEFGAPTGGPAGTHVSERRQARIIAVGYREWRRYRWAGPLFTYEGRDLSHDPTSRESFFGLLHYDFSPKPAYHSYHRAARRGQTQGDRPISAAASRLSLRRIRGVIAGRVRALHSSPPEPRRALHGKVSIRLLHLRGGSWRSVAPAIRTEISRRGGFRRRIASLHRGELRRGRYMIRACYLGSARLRPARGRTRAFRLPAP